ncbi:phage repressor protein C with HTH and peptisase S24 domain [Sphingomonas sp. PP-CE-3A-406]|uniref:S24 family peptidase n=1 Tax=Sphingomonas sp. PP-CE-3A-406 TaxID=2135659 RepID=UPI000EF9BF85|nr:S24 family peptidase [Sphingomonas sp. PP-CE-3A-406]RMB52385.1 phage repressor protein C with HTH and peptisase S24 domain [Sphingomonas sp. PP-CE-3A-406]
MSKTASDPDPRAALATLAAARGDSLAALSAMLGRNAAYLQQYVRRGSPRILGERDRRLLSAYLGVSETVLGAPPDRAVGFRIRKLDIAASAGPGAQVDGEIVLGTDTLDPGLARKLGLRDGQAAIIRVRGSSMEPGLFDGDHIVVDTADRTPRAKGGVYVIRIDDAVMVKRVALAGGALVATSDNPAAGPIPPGRIVVIGRVVWQMREPR